MDLVNFKREQDYHIQHVERVRSVKHVINTATPSSLGLKHLATRPKKQQLIDDRQQAIAKENRKLMERMTTILSGSKKSYDHERPPSLNEKARRQTVDKLNLENSLFVDRLKSVPSVLDVNKLENDFQRHLKIGSQLRRRQMKPMSLTPSSPTLRPRKNDGSTFDAALYISQHTGMNTMTQGNMQKQSQLASAGENVLLGSYHDSAISDAPITSMQDFRRQVISKKVLSQHTENSVKNNTAPSGTRVKANASYEFEHEPEN